MFGTLFLWASIGSIVAAIIVAAVTYVKTKSYDFKTHAILTGVQIILAAIGCFFLAKMNFQTWLAQAFVVTGGFLLSFAIPKLFSIQKQA